ncbi:MAG: hypothetical protein FWD26_08340 [Treponema sp.]|nr:hypothetical protein [Treponema sp.]
MSGRGGNNRKNRHRFSGRKEDPAKKSENQNLNKTNNQIFSDQKHEKNTPPAHERPRWTAPVLPANPITTPNCPWCGKQINDITTAISDRESGRPVHFDCVLARIVEMERLDTNDSVCYIGGGRFGIIHYNNPPDMRDFTVKKILEWEIKEKDHEWRRPISEYYSTT